MVADAVLQAGLGPEGEALVDGSADESLETPMEGEGNAEAGYASSHSEMAAHAGPLNDLPDGAQSGSSLPVADPEPKVAEEVQEQRPAEIDGSGDTAIEATEVQADEAHPSVCALLMLSIMPVRSD